MLLAAIIVAALHMWLPGTVAPTFAKATVGKPAKATVGKPAKATVGNAGGQARLRWASPGSLPPVRPP